MKKVPIWRGNDIGHGIKGGVLVIGSHEIKPGEIVPVNLLSAAAIKVFKSKGAIVDESPESESDEDNKLLLAEELFASTKSNLASAKKLLTESNKNLKQAKTNVTDQQKVIDNLPTDEEEAQIQAEESLVNNILTDFVSQNDSLQLAKDNAEKASNEAKEALSIVKS